MWTTKKSFWVAVKGKWENICIIVSVAFLLKNHKESIQIRGITTYLDILSLSFFCHVCFVRTYVGQLSAGVNLMKLGFSPKTNKRIEKKHPNTLQ